MRTTKKAKLDLVNVLLKVDRNTLTNNEINILYYLMKDKDIQERLEEVRKNENLVK